MKRTVLPLFAGILVCAVGLCLVGCQPEQVAQAARNAANLVNPACYADGALTQAEYDDLPIWEKLLYEKNSCELYVERDLFD